MRPRTATLGAPATSGRAYGHLVDLHRVHVAGWALVILAIEVILVLAVPRLLRLAAAATVVVLGSVGAPARFAPDTFMGSTIDAVIPRDVSPTTYLGAGVWLALSIIGIAVITRRGRAITPAVCIAVYNLVLLAASAGYLLMAGTPGYEIEAFSRLYLRTVGAIWLGTPLLLGTASLLLPFTTLQRVGMLLIGGAYLFTLAVARHVLFLWLLARFGAVVMLNLYLFLGPLLDVTGLVAVFALFAARIRIPVPAVSARVVRPRVVVPDAASDAPPLRRTA